MGFEVTFTTGVNVTARNLTEDDLLVLRTDMGPWFLSVAVEPFLQLDPEFGGSALKIELRADFLDIVHLQGHGQPFPDLRSWFKDMKTLDGKLAFRHGMWPTVRGITTTTRQAERAKRGL